MQLKFHVGPESLHLSADSRGLVINLVWLSMALAAFFKGTLTADGTLPALSAALTQHKVSWVCLLIAAWHVLTGTRGTITRADCMALAPAWILALSGWGSWPWLGLAVSLFAIRQLTPEMDGQARTGLSMGIAVAMHEACVPILAMLAGDTVLQLDALVAGLLAGIFVQGITLDATTLHGTNGHSVVLVWGCSSFSQIGNVVLFCWALCSLAGIRYVIRTRTLALCLMTTALMAVVFNTIRLSLMASDASLFQFIHDGPGATLFRLTLLSLATLIAYGYHRQCHSHH